MKKFYKILLLKLVLLYGYKSTAQTYIVDRMFGSCGSASLLLNEQGQQELKTIRVLPNQKILMAGNFFHANPDSISILLVQYRPDGIIDSIDFGTNGVLLSSINLRNYLQGITLHPDGRIIALGHENNSTLAVNDIPSVYFFTSQAGFDSSMNGTGVVAHRFDAVSSGSLYKAIVQGDGKIIAAGISIKNGSAGVNGIGLMKLKSNGSLDSLFGNLPGFPGRSRFEMDSVTDPHLFLINDRLVLPFVKQNNFFDTVWIARMLSNGNMDISFGTNGLLNTGMRAENLSAFLQQDNKLLLGGTLNEQGQPKRIILMRYTDALIPDVAFGTNGNLLMPTIGDAGSNNVLYKIIQQPDGKILIIGFRAPQSSPNNVTPFVLRLLENGNVDSSFNGSGSMIINSEFRAGWQQIDSTDTSNFYIARNPSFELVKYVPNTTNFGNAVTGDFDYVIEKQNVFFTDRSVNGQNYQWDFGDGDFSTLVNPTHTYAIPGSYQVTQNVSGPCDGQTVIKRIDVRGIYKITPTVGPDRGFTLCHVFGYGFDAASQVALKKDLTTIVASHVFFDTASQTLQANFQFANAPTGLYDLVVTTGSHTDTLPQSFEIQPIDIGIPWVQLVGPYNRSFRSLTGERINTFRLEYGVTGNATQYLIPLGLIISGNQLTANMLTTVINRGDTTNIPDSMKPHSSGFSRMYDEITLDSVWRFLALDYVVEANMTHILEFTVVSTTLEGEYGIRGYIGNSQFDQNQLDTIYSRGASGNICDNNCIACLLNAAGAIPGPIGCMASVVSIGCTISSLMTSPQSTLTGVINVAISIAGAAVACLTMTGNSTTQFLQAYQQALLGVIMKSSGGLLQNCAQAMVNILISGTCNGPAGQTGGKFPRRGSFDPNIKTGPASYNTNHYINKKIPLVYQVEFENLATATAPAFMVFVTDTLDKSVIDVSTIHFTGVNIANVNYPVFKTKDSFAMDIPMPAKGITVRVNGKADTATGIIRWEFLSLDTITMKLVDDPDKGFLPPNVDSISGKAFVSFTAEQRSTNTHLTSISNKAKIVFDVNAPIFTPVYTNIVDTVKPQSQVLNQFRVINDSTFAIKWMGTDAHAGIRTYKIFMSENDSAYQILGYYGKDSTVVRGRQGRLYKFISIAIDSVDNIEDPPANAMTNPDASFIFNGSLPVKLLAFTALKEKETSVLKWSTSSEVNSAYFILEHSINGISYTGLAKLDAAGNSSYEKAYSYIHLQPSKGFNYYRLKIVDRDGKLEYSPVRSLKFDSPGAITVLPNPAINQVYITTVKPGGVLRVISSTGKIVREMHMTGGTAAIDISTLPQGVYIIIYKTPGNEIWNEKLLVQRGL